MVSVQGEAPTYISSKSLLAFTNTCPEVPLFDSTHKPFCIPKTACTNGEWDDFRENNKFVSYEVKHFTECPEYSFHKSKDYLSNTKKRKWISAKMKAELQKEIDSRCPFCNSIDVGHFEIHHINNDPTLNEKENLLMLCPTCHSKITKGDISFVDVIKKKSVLGKL